MKKTVFILCFLFMVTPIYAGEFYKWTDEDGVLHFSDRPPKSPEDYEIADMVGVRGELEQKIRDSYIKSDYLKTVKLLEQQIRELEEKALKGIKNISETLYEKHLMLGYILDSRLNKPGKALKEYRRAIELRESFLPERSKAFSIEFVFMADVYERQKVFSRAVEYYSELLDEMEALNKEAEDDLEVLIATGLINFIKYRIDGLNLKIHPEKDFIPLLKKLKSSSLHMQTGITQFLALMFIPTAEYDFSVAMKSNLPDYIEQSPENLGSMIFNYMLVLEESKSYVDEASERAMEAYIEKYPESYNSLSLLFLFHRFYREGGQVEKQERILSKLEKIAEKRGYELIVGPESRFSSPEKTWETYKTALAQGDIDTVKECYVPGEWKFKKTFELIGEEKMKEIAKDMGDIKRLRGDDQEVKYRIRRKINGEDVAFYIHFYNIEGEWKMRGF